MIQHQVTLEKHSKILLALLSHKPVDFLEHTRHAIAAMVLEITYGLTIKIKNDPYVEVAEKALELFSEVTIPGTYLVDFLPFMKYLPAWLPGTSFKQKASEMKFHYSTGKNKPFAAIKEALKSGHASPSFVSNLFEASEKDLAGNGKGEIDEELIKSVGATIYLGGIDTTETAIQVFFVAMILYPDIQKAAQQELAKVIGSETLPIFKDRPNLPYVNALCKEVLRWQPALPLGPPHMTKQDDVIGEYFVPKGTLVMGTTWSLLHSEADYGPDVDAFNPERFLKKGVKDPDPAFGYGRRVCPGRVMADNMLFIIIASVLYTFDIKPHGTNLPSLDDFMPGLISRPKPFQCQIAPRTPAMVPLLEQLTSLLSENGI